MAKKQRRQTPTPEEIRQRCLEIQSEWCDEVRAQRETVRQRKEWRPAMHRMPKQESKSIDFGW